MAEKFSKKASSNIISFTQAIDPNISKLISYNEAWDIISEYCDITGNLYTQHNSKQSITIFDIIRESTNETIHSIEWQNKEVFADGDWDWTKIFKEVIEYLIKNGHKKIAFINSSFEKLIIFSIDSANAFSSPLGLYNPHSASLPKEPALLREAH